MISSRGHCGHFRLCGLLFDTIKTSLLRKPLSRRNNNSRVLRSCRISADPACVAYQKHSQVSGLPKTIPLGIPRPSFRKQIHEQLFYRMWLHIRTRPPYNKNRNVLQCSNLQLARCRFSASRFAHIMSTQGSCKSCLQHSHAFASMHKQACTHAVHMHTCSQTHTLKRMHVF